MPNILTANSNQTSNETSYKNDTLAAIATAPGRGGVGIVRVSGPLSLELAQRLAGFTPRVRYAHFARFFDKQEQLIDEGLVIYFAAPNSFTGEDVVEFQIHGGPVVLDRLLEELVGMGARLAEPGEFSQRAFLNDKLDLAQAEAIADLIAASSRQAAANAVQSLQGVFSKQIQDLVQKLIYLRMYVEAAIDFPEEEVDFLQDAKVKELLTEITHSLSTTLKQAETGNLVREGMQLVLAGKPNAGKSSLMNSLAGFEKALVTDIAGTTRDLLTEQIHIDGMPVHITDTAGLRETSDPIEQLGVAKAWEKIHSADHILLLVDAQTTQSLNPEHIWPEFVQQLKHPERITLVRNKVDLTQEQVGILAEGSVQNTSAQELTTPVINLVAKTGAGLEDLRQHLKQVMGLGATTEGNFSARRRHLQALEDALQAVKQGQQQLEQASAGELLAEDLRLAQDYLNTITGEFRADDLLGKIFSEFCIGK